MTPRAIAQTASTAACIHSGAGGDRDGAKAGGGLREYFRGFGWWRQSDWGQAVNRSRDSRRDQRRQIRHCHDVMMQRSGPVSIQINSDNEIMAHVIKCDQKAVSWFWNEEFISAKFCVRMGVGLGWTLGCSMTHGVAARHCISAADTHQGYERNYRAGQDTSWSHRCCQQQYGRGCLVR